MYFDKLIAKIAKNQCCLPLRNNPNVGGVASDTSQAQ